MKPQTALRHSPWFFHAAGALAVAVLTLIAWLVAIGPALHSRDTYQQLLTQFQNQREALHNAESRAQAAASRLNTLRDSLAQRPLLLTPQNELSKKLQQISDLATRVGMSLSSIEAGKFTSYQHHASIPIQLSARCSLPALWNFFHQLRGEMPDISVRSIDLNGRYNDATSIPILTMELSWHSAPTPQISLQ